MQKPVNGGVRGMATGRAHEIWGNQADDQPGQGPPEAIGPLP